MSAEAEATSKVTQVLEELNVRNVISLPKVGPFDFSISNAVIYMWVSAVIVFLFYFIIARRLKKYPDGLQSTGEMLLNFATGQLTGQFGEEGRKYYYISLTIFSYIFVTNVIGLIPKPEGWLAYTPTANINVTFGMAFVVFLVVQYQGFRRHGFGYLKAFLLPPGVPKALAAPLNVVFFLVHVMSECFKPLSLSIRLFGNTLAGHLIILVMLGLILEFESVLIGVAPALFVIVMTAFELFIAFIQAFIFSLLSGVYIEQAIYAGH